MSATICPNCGQPRAWTGWRKCVCGYDFGAGARPAPEEPKALVPPQTDMTKYRTFWLRFWAGFIDGFVLIPINLLTAYLVDRSHPQIVIIFGLMIDCSKFWLYTAILHWRFGQTVGKMAAGVKVLDVSEGRLPSFRQALLRDVGTVVSSVVLFFWASWLVTSGKYQQDEFVGGPIPILNLLTSLWFLLEIITMMTNAKRRALHDLIAGTVVVRWYNLKLPAADAVRA